ncbi:MAG: serine/threonine-protein kinase [Tepidisphaeraceae bacterium]
MPIDTRPDPDPLPNPPPDLPGEGEESDREERLLAIVRSYTAAVEAGQKPDRRAIMRRHPDLADDLSACLGGLTFLNNAAGQLAATAQDLVDPTMGGPQLLGDYRLIREIGRGGMGVVYEAEQVSLGRHVAVKVLPMAAALDKRQLQRFKNEAQAAAQLHHTHIVPVYAVGVERSTHYYAMQLIEGQSLADVIADLRMAAEQAPSTFSLSNASALNSSQPSMGLSSLRVAKRQNFYQSVARLGLQAAEALHHAHHAGIVHRDIKPANLLLDNDAGLWITDFGLAQFYAAENNLTQSSDRPGTLRYMSPEQASGSAVVLDQRTDVYSLGVTLYELLTLERRPRRHA